jgi:hypothetical protein
MTDAAIAAAEARLGVRLPSSYRAHVLRDAPGYRRSMPVAPGDHASPPLLSVDEIDRFEALEPEWLDAFRQGYEAEGGGAAAAMHDDPDDPATMRIDELGGTIVISAVVDERVLLLNPARVGSDGEWEAWDFANWYPGAYRYPSFEELMRGVSSE